MSEREGRGAGGDAIVVLENVWKVFGESAAAAIAAAREEGLSKAQVASRFGCVLGVAGASIEVRRGEIFCIMGLSGSGKSTLLRHINRLLEPSAGRVLVEGGNVLEMNEKQLRTLRASRIGMVFQSFALLPHRTVRENVALPLEVQGASLNDRFDLAEAALEKVDLGGWGDRHPADLSGGMQQRVGLARALAADPAILLMDEPFSALDPLIRRQLQDQFVHLCRELGKTAVFITHDLDEAIRIGSRVAIMKDGAIIQTGTAEEIVSDPQDAYIADFVANISRLHVVHAHRIMEPLEAYRRRSRDAIAPQQMTRCNSDATLAELIDICASTDAPVGVNGPDGEVVGVIDKTRLLEGIRGGT